ncbi:MAG: hypothetical protein KJO21_02810 [Verrucomicrobiae bacterium]|nr:hypothetical protein [Verrucomicrobiae bacterium]NNJ41848.1 hypothetical protein [Akkermansiaceae bacterium]
MKRLLRKLTCIALCLISPACSKEEKACGQAAATDDSKGKKNPALYLEWHKKCITDDTGSIDEQIKQFENRLKKNPSDHLAMAYLGSACALRAKASFWGLTKLKYLNRGKSLMDEAVKAAPKNPRVRMVRAIGYYKVPKRFDTRPTAVKDFQVLIPIASENPSDLAINERQAILYYAYLTFSEEGHQGAQQAKSLCHQLAPSSKYGQLTHP